MRAVHNTGTTEVTRDAPTFAASLTAKQLHCRELGHVWRDHTVSMGEDRRSFHRALRCSSCLSLRVQVLDSTGHVVTNGYRYSDGYLAKDVEPGFTRDVFRLEAITRWFERNTGADIRAVG